MSNIPNRFCCKCRERPGTRAFDERRGKLINYGEYALHYDPDAPVRVLCIECATTTVLQPLRMPTPAFEADPDARDEDRMFEDPEYAAEMLLGDALSLLRPEVRHDEAWRSVADQVRFLAMECLPQIYAAAMEHPIVKKDPESPPYGETLFEG